MKDFELHHGDMLDVLPTLAKGSVAMVFADLPYGLLKNRAWDLPIPLSQFWQALYRIVSSAYTVAMTASMLFASTLVQSNLARFRYDLVWQKHLASNFMMAKKRPLCFHENVLIFGVNSAPYIPQMRPESERVDIRQNNYKSQKKSTGWHGQNTTIGNNMKGPMYPKSIIITHEDRKNNIHPTQKPVALLEWLIATYTNPGDTVLDPCFGSNTTGVACARLGRKYIGIEKDAEYFRIGKERLEREVGAMRNGPTQGRLAV